MRFKILFLLLSFTICVNAAIYAPNNVVTGSGTTDGLIQNLDGSLNSGGLLAMGYFTDAYSISSSNMSANIAAFTTVASVIVGSNSSDLGGSFAGYYQGANINDTDILSGDPLIGRNLYIFVGNTGTLAGSTQWGILKIGTLAIDTPLENTYSANPYGQVNPYLGAVAFGTLGTYTGNASGFGSSTYQTLKLAVPIPEPSTAILAALGSLALLRRRRKG